MSVLVAVQQATGSGDGSSAPWWGVAIIAGSFTIVGAIFTMLGTAVLDRRRRRQDDKQWARREALQAYYEYMVAFDRHKAVGNHPINDEAKAERERLLWELNSAETKVTVVCPPQVVEALGQFHEKEITRSECDRVMRRAIGIDKFQTPTPNKRATAQPARGTDQPT